MLKLPPGAVCCFRDGNKWCCVYPDFGDTLNEAYEDLKAACGNE